MTGKLGIVVTSAQLDPSSLPFSSLGATHFLDFLLTNLRRAFPDTPKIFAMGFEDLQEIDEQHVQSIRGYDFEFFIGDRDVHWRLLKAARRFELAHVVEVPVSHVLTSIRVTGSLMTSHLRSRSDLSACHNLPGALAPVISSRESLERCYSMRETGFLKHFGMEETVRGAASHTAFMLANPKYFKLNLHHEQLAWEGKVDPFEDRFAGLVLDSKERRAQLRNLIYEINKESIEPEDVIDFFLIRSMQRAWGQWWRHDTKYIVADNELMSTPDDYESAALDEVNAFVLEDAVFLDGRDPEECSIFELGCGHGRLLRVLATRFKHVHGTDVTRERYLEARYRCRGFDNIHITQNDGRSVCQYEDQVFDLAFAHGVFVHINSKKIITNYIAELARVVKPGGRIKFDVYAGEDSFGITLRDFGIGARYSDQELRSLFDACDLKVIELRRVTCRQFQRTGTKRALLPLEQIIATGEKL